MTPDTEAPRVLRSLPGRARVHLPGWSGEDAAGLEAHVRGLPAVAAARADGRTRNLLVHFDPARLDERRLVAELARATVGSPPPRRKADDRPPPADRPRPTTRRAGRRARIALHGLDRDPELARRTVERLESLSTVQRAAASPLTGRVLVELADDAADLVEVLETIAGLEEPFAGTEPDFPAHPLDPAPIIEGGARLIGAGLGLGLLFLRRAMGAAGPPVASRGPGEAAALLSLTEGYPAVVNRLESALGHERKELVYGAGTIVGLTSSGGTWGLLLSAAAGLRLLTEALARRASWREYEEREERSNGAAAALPGHRLRLTAGERVPLPAVVAHGFGTATGEDGLPQPVRPGARLGAGARVQGGPIEVELEAPPGFGAQPRPVPPRPPPHDRYVHIQIGLALAASAVTALVTRSPPRALGTLLLMTPRAALVGSKAADLGASARAVRCGLTVVGSRPGRPIRRPDALLFASPRVLTDGLETSEVVALGGELEAGEVTRIASLVATAAGSPWGSALRPRGSVAAVDGTFDGETATAEINGLRWTLEPLRDAPPHALREHAKAGNHVLVLRRSPDRAALGAVALRPRLAAGAERLIALCRRWWVRVEVLAPAPTPAAREVARRAGVLFTHAPDGTAGLAEHVRASQRAGDVVAVIADGAEAAAAFDAADLALGLTSGRSGRFPARADLLAPRLDAVAAVIDVGVRHDAAQRDAVVLSMIANAVGATWGLRTHPRFARSGRPATLAGLASIADGWLRLRGGRPARTVSERLSDPMPERWGRESAAATLQMLGSSRRGLTMEEARSRWSPRDERPSRNPLLAGIADQLRSPLALMLLGGAGLSLATGAIADVGLIAAVLAANALTGAWQERRADEAAEELESLNTGVATVVRAGARRRVPTTELVPGDVLVLGPGDRVGADARLLASEGLEVDESALTGESLPVPKAPEDGTDASRIVLEGSDVTAGRGRAVVVAVGPDTRLGATAAALAVDERPPTALDERLSRIVRRSGPLIALGGAGVAGLGVLRGHAVVPQLALGASIAIAAVPEGLPLMAKIAEAGVARRLAERRALVTRLSSVEALGRVDVACADKTGTLTEGRLAVTNVVDPAGRGGSVNALDDALRDVLAAAVLASPPPDTPDLAAHATDAAIVDAGLRAGLGERARVTRDARAPFDPARSYHAEIADGRLYAKGATEVLEPRCATVRVEGAARPLDNAGRAALLEHAHRLAHEGLRVLMVAEGTGGTPEDPRDLTAVGFVGLSDPLRATVPAAVRRCHEAGVRVLMLTGDHPETARAIALQAGLPVDDDKLLLGTDVAELDDHHLNERLERATVVARTTPLEKLRIVEALQRRGHVVAMTGDGVNDAPALRLADVGVAIGERSTEVARRTADLIVADGDFSTIVEALVEGRGFWGNMRRSLGLLLGGNAGEVALMLAAGGAGLPMPLTTRQILTVNLATDVLPAVAIALQRPEHRDLAALAREGGAALDRPLRDDIVRRGVATAIPSFAAYVAALRGGQPQATGVAFAAIVTTQLAQTVELGRTQARLTGTVGAAVGGSLGLTAAALWIPGLRAALGLTAPGASGLVLVGGATVGAVALARALAPERRTALPA